MRRLLLPFDRHDLADVPHQLRDVLRHQLRAGGLVLLEGLEVALHLLHVAVGLREDLQHALVRVLRRSAGGRPPRARRGLPRGRLWPGPCGARSFRAGGSPSPSAFSSSNFASTASFIRGSRRSTSRASRRSTTGSGITASSASSMARGGGAALQADAPVEALDQWPRGRRCVPGARGPTERPGPLARRCRRLGKQPRDGQSPPDAADQTKHECEQCVRMSGCPGCRTSMVGRLLARAALRPGLTDPPRRAFLSVFRRSLAGETLHGQDDDRGPGPDQALRGRPGPARRVVRRASWAGRRPARARTGPARRRPCGSSPATSRRRRARP